MISQHLDTVDSTQIWAKNHLSDFDLTKLCYVSACVQTKGLGTRGKSWHSPSNQNIYISYIYRLQKDPPYYVNLAQILSLSVAKTLQYLGFSPTLKWPNDILLSKKKCGGVLCEIINDPLCAVIGLGLNVNMPLSELSHIDIPSTSLFIESKQLFSIPEIICLVTQNFEEALKLYESLGFKGFYETYEKLMPYLGYDVYVENKKIGTSYKIEEDGSLRVKKSDHSYIKITSGSMPINESFCSD